MHMNIILKANINYIKVTELLHIDLPRSGFEPLTRNFSASASCYTRQISKRREEETRDVISDFRRQR